MPEGEHYTEPTQFGTWIRSPAVRETVESVLIAILLALLFRFFEAEAYVIPTGSMAPNLQGRHVDLVCSECDFEFRGGATDRSDGTGSIVRRAACPICQNPMMLETVDRRDHRPFSGDRVLVNKFAYDFWMPERFDVIVFKYPNNGKQNFIKRLLGLPNESLLIENGDLYVFQHATETFAERKIARKTAKKLPAMLQMVDDTNHIPETLIAAGWPSRWSTTVNNGMEWTVSDKYNEFTLDNASKEIAWLRYRHLRPRIYEWDKLRMGDPELPNRIKNKVSVGELVTDHYAYNDVTPSWDPSVRDWVDRFNEEIGMHWVGDLAVEAEVTLLGGSGSLAFDVVEGGVHFLCTINAADGSGKFSLAGSQELIDKVSMVGETEFSSPVSGSGDYKIMFANVDDKLFLYVNDKIVAECEYNRTGDVLPAYTPQDAGDAEPIGVGGSNGLNVKVDRLKVLRDIYYVSRNLSADANRNISTEYQGFLNVPAIKSILQTPNKWRTPEATALFESRKRDESFVFRMEDNQYFPMGDNSPQSQDARIWPGKPFVDGSYLLGEALFIYWPHAKTKPVPFWPNFGRMKFIR